MSELVIDTRVDGATELRLNRPDKGNALDAALVERLHDAFDAAIAAGARAIVFTGAGRHFCTGFDLAGLSPDDDAALLHRFVRIELLLQKIHAAPVLTVGYAHGRTIGAGADLIAACEKRFALEGATMMFPGAGFGLVLGTGRLAERVGAELTRDLVRTGRPIAADEALRTGLVSAVVAGDPDTAAIAGLVRTTARLDAPTAATINAVTSRDGDRDLAELVRSAARPGLAGRIIAYREASLAAR